MTLRFKPMPVLTVLTVLGVGFLLALGYWQYQRLQWKTALLAEIDAASEAPPFTSLAALETALANGEPVDFRRIGFSGVYVDGVAPRLVYLPQSGGIAWRAYTPVESAGRSIFAAVETVGSEARDSFVPRERTDFVGYVRRTHPMRRMEAVFKSKPNPETNRWFRFNQTGDWLDGLDANPEFESLYIDVDPAATDAARLKPRVPQIANNHRDYMLTWWSFAVLLLIFYALIHRRAGRLSW